MAKAAFRPSVTAAMRRAVRRVIACTLGVLLLVSEAFWRRGEAGLWDGGVYAPTTRAGAVGFGVCGA